VLPPAAAHQGGRRVQIERVRLLHLTSVVQHALDEPAILILTKA
jgi:hypothetical protein